MLTLMKRGKQAYYDKYFETNWDNVKNTWKGVKSLISPKSVASSVPTVLSLDNGDTITGFSLMTCDLYYTIPVEVFTNHILAEKTYFTSHIE